jgi:alkylation response protein AidB-like acyl-CoA dehydrogenase
MNDIVRNAPPFRTSTVATSDTRDHLARAKSLATLIEKEAIATEIERTATTKTVAALRDAELFWSLVPRDMGGAGLDLVAGIEIWEELSRADGSTGWALMANATSTAIAATHCGNGAVDMMFGGGERAITSGMFGPGGKCIEVTGGYQGGGKFSFGSGCAHASWLGGGMMLLDGGKPRLLPDGTPQVRVFFVPRAKARILDNWNVIGLIGTGSFDYEITEQFVAEDFTMERTSTKSQRGGPLYDLGFAAFGSAGHAAVALGLMKRALEEIAQIASLKKRAGYPSPIAGNQVFMYEFGLNEAAYWSARAYVLSVFANVQDTVLSGGALSPEQRGRMRQCTTWTHKVAADVVRFCHMWGGSESVRNPTALGRCMRDMYVATQHIYVDPKTVWDAAPAIIDRWTTLRSSTPPIPG